MSLESWTPILKVEVNTWASIFEIKIHQTEITKGKKVRNADIFFIVLCLNSYVINCKMEN